ncbi:MAG: 16S rRNA (adenine(1518)-N(6)/adenine(1519)-N(6))-dimethyltransferase RsmA [Syntrophorhabdales bacterium]|jgi:16S rRNA (adenine1518-N6/adenine1519-N6)-dimethyltransferase
MLKKSLGQHLLKDRNLLEKMVRMAGIGPDDFVLEIGPGEGDLTRCIAKKALLVYAVELDERFREALSALAREFPNVEVVFSDILGVSFSDFRNGRGITVMGNIPYYLTGEILFKLLDEKAAIRAAYLTMQKEVAERIVSPPRSRSYGAVSVIFRLYADVRLLLLIKPGLFIPPPKVESAFISVVFKDGKELDRGLIEFVKLSFRYKRKYLRNCLEGRFRREEIDALYVRMGFPPSIRAEEIEPEGFVEMHRFLGGGLRA